MRWLYPHIPLAHLPAMAKVAAAGALLAAVYGAVHDQVSYTISPEYFTKMKFDQFAWANLGLPPRWYASEIGVLATWWVGLIAGWLLARAGMVELPPRERWPRTWRAFGIVAVVTLLGSVLGYGYGSLIATRDLSAWSRWQRILQLEDLPAFVTVAWLHNGGYLGALGGLILAVIYVRRGKSSTPMNVHTAN
ncbi:hypothetical protein [Anatilimnocola floriformis]|uniref:hypothetical protein n=1 Tax=Anatilimnocola floriformis TaxID=2948575 RepID=UPI0020C5623A|nr:hypothetical protein [Anatilimnocola floriformis]